jgi:hypothetical protein
MTTTKLVAISLVGVLCQAHAPLPIRIGPTGSKISASDVAAIRRVIGEEERLWLLVGLAPGFIKGRFVDVYAEPDVNGGSIRRGRLATVTTASPNFDSISESEWRKIADGRWAQVPFDGADPDALTGSRDPVRPFMVQGDLSDGQLIELVGLIRSSPRSPEALPEPIGGRQVQGTWPIIQITSADGTIRVKLIDESGREKSGQLVTVVRGSDTWIIRGLTYWIAD